MKEDEARTDYEPHQLLLYVEKADGSYGELQTGSHAVKHYVEDFWDKQQRLQARALERLRAGEISPVSYYMTVHHMALADLASRVGQLSFQVKRHLQPRHFARISVALAARYAEVFNVPLAALFQVVVQPAGGAVVHRRTQNPLLVLTTYHPQSPDSEGTP